MFGSGYFKATKHNIINLSVMRGCGCQISPKQWIPRIDRDAGEMEPSFAQATQIV